MKNIFKILLSVLIVLCLFPGCNGDVEPTPPVPPVPPEEAAFSMKGKIYDSLEAVLAAIPSKGSKAASDYVVTLLRPYTGPGVNVDAKDFTLDLNGLKFTMTGTLSITGGSKVVITGQSGSDVDLGSNSIRASGSSDVRILQHTSVSGVLESLSSSAVRLDDSAKLSGCVITDNGGFTVSGDSSINADVTAKTGSAIAFETEGNIITTLSKTASDTVVFTRDISVSALAEGSDNKVITADGVVITGAALEKDTEYTVLLELKPYKDIVSALADAKNKNTLVLLKDINNSGNTLYIDKEITLNLQGYNIGSGTVSTERNVTILGTGTVSAAMTAGGGAHYTLNGGTYTEDPGNSDKFIVPLNYKITGTSPYTVSVVTAGEAAAQIGEKYYLTLQNAVNDSGNAAEIKLLKDVAESTLTVSQGRNINLVLNGCSLTLTTFTNNANVSFSTSGSVNIASVVLENGSVTEISISGTFNCTLPSSLSSATLKITGGTFTSDPSTYVPAGYKVEGSSPSFTVSEITEAEAAAEVNGILYMTFDQALSAAVSSEGDVLYSIKLLNNVNLTSAVNLSFKDTLELDLNGKSLSSAAGVFVITKGTLSIEGTGKVSGAEANCAITVGDSSTGFSPSVIIAEGVTVSSASGDSIRIVGNDTERRSALISGSVGSVSSTGTASVIQIGNKAVLNGTLSASGILGISGGNYSGEISAQNIYIDGGTFTDVTPAAPTVTVNGGTFTASSNSEVLKADGRTVSITGGEFTAPEGKVLFKTLNNGSVVITGGSFSGNLGTESDNIVLTGGTFDKQPLSNFIVPGYAATYNLESAVWTVSLAEVSNKVAQIGERYFSSLDDALAAAAENQTVSLLKDIQVDSPVEINKTITLVLNGNLTASSGPAVSVAEGKTLTLSGSSRLTGSISTTGSANVKITGGTYNFDPSEYVSASDYDIIPNSTVSPSWWTVMPKSTNPVASVKGNNYETIAAAVNAAAVNDTVVILRNVEEEAELDKNITLNLAGYTLTGNLALSSADGAAVAGPGTINGSVTHSAGTATLNGISAASLSSSESAGNLTVSSGVFGSISKAGSGNMSVYGATVNSGVSCSEGSLSLTNCTVSAASDVVSATGGTVTIDGGTYTASSGNILSASGGSIAVKGGSFTGSLFGAISISGGSFSVDPSDFVATGCQVTQSGDRWVVTSAQSSVTNVAKIGEHYYTSLGDAVVAVAEGQTIELLANIHLETTLNLANINTYSIYLNRYSIDSTDCSALSVTAGSVTLCGGGTVSAANQNNTDEIYVITASSAANLTIGAGVTVSSGTFNGISHSGSGKLTIESGSNISVPSGKNAVCVSGSASYAVNGGTLSGNIENASSVGCTLGTGGSGPVVNGDVINSHTGSTTVSAGIVNGNVSNSSGTTYITSGVVNGNISNSNSAGITNVTAGIVNGNISNSDGTTNISGGTVHGSVSKTGGSVSVSGGTFYSQPDSALVASGYTAVQSKNTWVVVANVPNAVALVTGNSNVGYYTDFADALDKAAGGSLQLLENNTAPASGKSVSSSLSIDLNGHTLATGGKITVTSTGALTINNSTGNGVVSGSITVEKGGSIRAEGTIYAEDGGALRLLVSCLENNGTVVLNKDIELTGTTPLVVGSGRQINLNSKTLTGSVNYTSPGIMTVKDGTISGSVTNSAAGVVSLADTSVTGAILNSSTGSLIISGAASASNITVSGGNVTILGGTFSSTSGNAVDIEGGSVSITGGTFTAAVNASAGKVNISGGTFNGALNGNIVITGGTFSDNPSTYVAPGYSVAESEGKWTVSSLGLSDAKAVIGHVYFNSISAALDAASNGDRITLLKDESFQEALSITKTLTLALNANLSAPSLAIAEGKSVVLSGTGSLVLDTKNPLPAADRLSIRGGTYNFGPADYVDGTRYVIDHSSENYVVSELNASNAAASLGSFFYSSVQNAVDAASYNQTVNVLRSVTENVSTTKTITLNLGETAVLTGSITATSGTLTLTGTGRVNGSIAQSGGVVSIKGGTYNFDPTDFLSGGYIAAEENNLWTVSAKDNNVCSIGTSFYTSVQEAVEAAHYLFSTTIRLIGSSYEADFTVPAGKNIILDLGTEQATQTLKANITVNGSLRIKGSGTVTGTITKGSSGSVYVYGGTFSFDPVKYGFVDTDLYVVTSEGGSWSVSKVMESTAAAYVQNGGIAEYYASLSSAIENATSAHTVYLLRGVEEDVNISSSFACLKLNSYAITGNLNVTGGSVSLENGSISGNISNSGNGAVILDGVNVGGNTFNSSRGSIVLKTGTVVNVNLENTDGGSIAVNGATVSGSVSNNASGAISIGDTSTVNGNISSGNTNGRILITGGTFSGSLSGTDSSLVITGGSFKSNPTAFVNTTYYEVEEVEDYYQVSVREENMVAMIGTEYYPTIESAINAVPAGNESTTITLLADVVQGADLMIPDSKTIVLELNDKTVTRNIVSYGQLEIGTTGNVNGNINASGGLVTITGGVFTGNLIGGSGNNKHISITGGTFSVDPTVYVAPGYGATEEGDWWTVTPTNS